MGVGLSAVPTHPAEAPGIAWLKAAGTATHAHKAHVTTPNHNKRQPMDLQLMT
jgi:hypothetical protein